MSCRKGLTKCPRFHGQGGFDCINTSTDPDSCGGCVSPDGKGLGEGQDCNSIPNVSTTRCVSGTCVICESFMSFMLSRHGSDFDGGVASCRKNYKTSDDGKACISPRRSDMDIQLSSRGMMSHGSQSGARARQVRAL